MDRVKITMDEYQLLYQVICMATYQIEGLEHCVFRMAHVGCRSQMTSIVSTATIVAQERPGYENKSGYESLI